MEIEPDFLDINPNFIVEVDYVGRGQHKVITADNFYQYPDKILKLALDLPFTNRFEIIANFPGVRASLNVDTHHLVETISTLWGSSLQPFFTPQPVVFSGITTNNYPLNIGQLTTSH